MSADGGQLTFLESGLDDEALVALVRGESVTKVAIDAPFGWPRTFVRAVSSYSCTGRQPRWKGVSPIARPTEVTLLAPKSSAEDGTGTA